MGQEVLKLREDLLEEDLEVLKLREDLLEEDLVGQEVLQLQEDLEQNQQVEMVLLQEFKLDLS